MRVDTGDRVGVDGLDLEIGAGRSLLVFIFQAIELQWRGEGVACLVDSIRVRAAFCRFYFNAAGEDVFP